MSRRAASPATTNNNRSPRSSSSRASLGVGALGFLALLLVAPTWALVNLSAKLDWRVIAGTAVVISGIAFFAYRHDKRAAEAGDERISEATLHLAALLGGWPGAFLAQRLFRHKTVKLPFQAVFWLIVAAHQFAAIDYLRHGELSRAIVRQVRAALM